MGSIGSMILKAVLDFGRGLVMDFWKDFQRKKLEAEAHRAKQLEKSLQSAKEAADKARADQAKVEARLADADVSDDDWNAGN